MEDKRAQYGEDEIITLEFDDGVTFDCGMMGTFELDGKEYIALEALDDSDDVYLYGYQRNDTDFDLLDIPEEEFDRVAAEFDRLMDELSEDDAHCAYGQKSDIPGLARSDIFLFGT